MNQRVFGKETEMNVQQQGGEGSHCCALGRNQHASRMRKKTLKVVLARLLHLGPL